MTGMTPRRLDWALRAHGPALSRWPEGERRAALALLAHSQQARDMLADALLRDPDEAPHDPAALARMEGRLRRRMAARTAPPALAHGMRLGTLAACAVAGLWLGLAAPEADAWPDFFASSQVSPLDSGEL